MTKKIAVFGGSFNPPLNSHTKIANEIIDKFNMEKLIFVPVNDYYNKSTLIDDDHRLNMLKIICDKNNKLEVSDVEIKNKEKTYTIETLNKIKNIYPEHEIYFILGTDNLKELSTWKNGDKIVKNFKLIVIERDNDKIEDIIKNDNLLLENKEAIINSKIKKIPLSSTLIRNKIKNKEDVSEFLDLDVLEYINKKNLYYNYCN